MTGTGPRGHGGGMERSATDIMQDAVVAAVLDATCAVSEWVHPSPGRSRLRVVVLVAGVGGEIDLFAREGPEEQLRLGRDWLSGRARIGC